jgi:hypothetical protein
VVRQVIGAGSVRRLNGIATQGVYSHGTLASASPCPPSLAELEGQRMHIQAKARPVASPPDLDGFFTPISAPEPPAGGPPRAPVNIEGVSGDHMETGGELYFTFDHDRRDDVAAWLKEKGYEDIVFMERDTDFFQAELSANEPGQLLAAIREATSRNLASGRIIKNVLIGQETQSPNRFYVNISFQEVKTG